LRLPLWVGLGESEQEQVVQALVEALSGAR